MKISKLAAPIQLRLDSEKLAAYQAAAVKHNLSLADYLRARLDDPERLADETARLRDSIEALVANLAQPQTRKAETSGPDPLIVLGGLYEILQYLRNSNPQLVEMAKAEVRRVGLKVLGSAK